MLLAMHILLRNLQATRIYLDFYYNTQSFYKAETRITESIFDTKINSQYLFTWKIWGLLFWGVSLKQDSKDQEVTCSILGQPNKGFSAW